jgi:hypothetical protein
MSRATRCTAAASAVAAAFLGGILLAFPAQAAEAPRTAPASADDFVRPTPPDLPDDVVWPSLPSLPGLPGRPGAPDDFVWP